MYRYITIEAAKEKNAKTYKKSKKFTESHEAIKFET